MIELSWDMRGASRKVDGKGDDEVRVSGLSVENLRVMVEWIFLRWLRMLR